MRTELPSKSALKLQAKRLRDALAENGQTLTHSAALETLAHQHGYRDWNTLHAAAENVAAAEIVPFIPGNRTSGAYMGKPFSGVILGCHHLGADMHRLTLRFDEPVDVVDFESFSALRSRVTVVVNSRGVSPRKRSDGTAHIRLDG